MILRGIEYMHSLKIMHRDIKLDNILYNSEEKYISFSVGSAITTGSIPENEYEECLLKAKAMLEVLR